MSQEYVPFLEKYFELNAYPTSMERLKLAQQTKMTPRQIEVWVSSSLYGERFVLR